MTATASELGKYLEEHASNGTFVCYSEVAEHFLIPNTIKWKDNPLSQLCGFLDKEDTDAYRPLRTSVIVLKDGIKKTVPSKGYFRKLSDYRKIPIAKTAPEKRRVHGEELQRLWKHYGFQPKTE